MLRGHDIVPGARHGLAIAAALLAGLLATSCSAVMQQSIDHRFGPDLVRATDAAGTARECRDGVGTPAQQAVAAAAADSARIAAARLQLAMDDLQRAHAERLAATNARVDQARQAENWTAEIAELQRKAGIALVESGVDHDIRFLHGLYLPARYQKPTPEQPNVEAFTNADFLLVATANVEARRALEWAEAARAMAAAHPQAGDSERRQLEEWKATVEDLARDVSAANETAGVERYQTADDLTQLAVRNAYKAMELAFRARALQMTIELRGDAAERSARAAEREQEAIAAYQAALDAAGEAQRRAQAATEAAYASATACGIDTAPVVPDSPEWNDTFWEISSP